MQHAIDPNRPLDPLSPRAERDATSTPVRLDIKRQPVKEGRPLSGLMMKLSLAAVGLLALNVLVGVLSYLVGLLVTVPLSLAVAFLLFRRSFLKKSERDNRYA